MFSPGICFWCRRIADHLVKPSSASISILLTSVSTWLAFHLICYSPCWKVWITAVSSVDLGSFIPKIIEGSRTETPKAQDINRTAIRSSSNLHNAFQRRPDETRTGSVNRGSCRLLTGERSGQLSRWLTLVEMEVIYSPISRGADPTRLGGLH